MLKGLENRETNVLVTPITMKAEDAARYIGISYWLILEMTKRNEIPFIACGSRKLFRKEALDNWMDEQERKSTIEVSSENQYGKLRKIL